MPFPVGARDFGLLFHSDRLWCSHILLLKRIADFISSRVKRPGPEAYHSPRSSTEFRDSSSNRSTVVHSCTCLYGTVLTEALEDVRCTFVRLLLRLTCVSRGGC